MDTLIQRYNAWIACLIIALSAAFVWINFPAENMYYTGADEGRYYYQAKTIAENGLINGIEKITNEFIADVNLHDSPNPLRTANIFISSLFIKANDSYKSLSAQSLCWHVILLISAFLFVRKKWNASLALITLLLLSFSTLGVGMSRRALADSQAYTSAAISFFFFISFLETKKIKPLLAFVCSIFFAVLIKETAILLLPFYGATALYLKSKKQLKHSWFWVAAAIVLPGILIGLNFLFFYGIQNFITIAGIITQPSAYSAWLGQGPWYRYLIDYIALSPFTLIAAISVIGYLLFTTDRDKTITLVLMLFIYLLFIFSFLTKNVRYVLLIDLAIRMLAAYMIWKTIIAFPKFRHAVVVALIMIVSTDIFAFKKYFIADGVYDPMSYNLLIANKIIPNVKAAESTVKNEQLSASILQAKQLVVKKPSSINYQDLGFQYYSNKLYLESIWAYREAIRLDPYNAIAYNNICAAYNELGDWQNAKKACEDAIKIDSNLQLARNNLNWAMQIKSNEGK